MALFAVETVWTIADCMTQTAWSFGHHTPAVQIRILQVMQAELYGTTSTTEDWEDVQLLDRCECFKMYQHRLLNK